MAVEKDQEFVEFIVKNIVSNPDGVSVKRTVDEMGVLIELTVDKDDMSVIIGKEGRTVNSIRTLLRVLGAKNDARLNLKVVEPEGSERPPKEEAPKAKEEPKEEEEDAPMADLDLE